MEETYQDDKLRCRNRNSNMVILRRSIGFLRVEGLLTVSPMLFQSERLITFSGGFQPQVGRGLSKDLGNFIGRTSSNQWP